jgi:hypothetical protein
LNRLLSSGTFFNAETKPMGCLPIPILFVLGVVVGSVFWGDRGALWGAGIGLLLGLGLAGAFVTLLRRRR